MEITITDDKIKDLLKSAMLEALDERRDYIKELLEEVIEEIGMTRAIEEGSKTPLINREEVFRVLGA